MILSFGTKYQVGECNVRREMCSYTHMFSLIANIATVSSNCQICTCLLFLLLI